MAAGKYTGVSITPEAREDLRLFAARAGGVIGQRISITDALRLAVHIASAHLTADVPRAAQTLGIVTAGQETP